MDNRVFWFLVALGGFMITLLFVMAHQADSANSENRSLRVDLESAEQENFDLKRKMIHLQNINT